MWSRSIFKFLCLCFFYRIYLIGIYNLAIKEAQFQNINLSGWHVTNESILENFFESSGLIYFSITVTRFCDKQEKSQFQSVEEIVFGFSGHFNLNDFRLSRGQNRSSSHCVKRVRIRSYSGPSFPVLNTERYGVFSPNAGKYRTRITPNKETFLRSDRLSARNC